MKARINNKAKYLILFLFIILNFTSLKSQKQFYGGGGFQANYKLLFLPELDYSINYINSGVELFSVNDKLNFKLGTFNFGCLYEVGNFDGFYFRSGGDFGFGNVDQLGLLFGYGYHFKLKKENRYLRPVIVVGKNLMEYWLDTKLVKSGSFNLGSTNFSAERIGINYIDSFWNVTFELDYFVFNSKKFSKSISIGYEFKFLSKQAFRIYELDGDSEFILSYKSKNLQIIRDSDKFDNSTKFRFLPRSFFFVELKFTKISNIRN